MRRAAPSKYRAIATTVDGIRFASKAEAKRYGELKLLEKAGEIEGLELQPVFVLKAPLTTGTIYGAMKAHAGELPVIGKAIMDFKYFDLRGKGWITEDTKGFDTPLSRWKRRHVEKQYGIKVAVIK